MDTQVEEQVQQTAPPAISSDSVCLYLSSMAQVLSSIVVDINAQINTIKNLTTKKETKNDNESN